jgi:hypothetical protein
MVATINRSQIPTGPDGVAREPRFVRNVGADGNDVSFVATATARLASSAASTNAAVVKASAGTVVQISGFNNSASVRYLRLYDKTTTPVPASDAARKVYALPANTLFVFDNVGSFATGIGYAITGAAADLDNTAIAVADILCLNVDYV